MIYTGCCVGLLVDAENVNIAGKQMIIERTYQHTWRFSTFVLDEEPGMAINLPTPWIITHTQREIADNNVFESKRRCTVPLGLCLFCSCKRPLPFRLTSAGVINVSQPFRSRTGGIYIIRGIYYRWYSLVRYIMRTSWCRWFTNGKDTHQRELEIGWIRPRRGLTGLQYGYVDYGDFRGAPKKTSGALCFTSTTLQYRGQWGRASRRAGAGRSVSCTRAHDRHDPLWYFRSYHSIQFAHRVRMSSIHLDR